MKVFRILLSLIISGLIATVSMSFLYSADSVVSGEQLIISSEPAIHRVVPKPSIKKSTPIILKNTFLTPTYILGEYRIDSGLLRFVSRDISLTDKTYKPEGLVSISGAYINQAGRNSSLRPEAKSALDILAREFHREFNTRLVVISGYRSAAYQQRLWDLGRCSDTHCAPPGNSEHQLGLAVDVFDATSEDDFIANRNYKRYVAWFQSNAHLYGWHQSYQKGEAVDGYMVEPWHWRYLGVDMATRLYNLRWTYTEYVQFQEYLRQWW